MQLASDTRRAALNQRSDESYASADLYQPERVEEAVAADPNFWPLQHSLSSQSLSASTSSRRKVPPPLELSPKTRTRHAKERSGQSDSPARSSSITYIRSPEQSLPSGASAHPRTLPASASLQSNLSYLSSSSADEEPHTAQSAALSQSSTSPQSPPQNDRSKLVGLGELSTPRWTAAGRGKWGSIGDLRSAASPVSRFICIETKS